MNLLFEIILEAIIKEFFIELDPELIVKAPSRINIINPLDAVEGDFWMPSVAINGINNPLSTFVYIKNLKGISKLKQYNFNRKKGELRIELVNEEVFEKKISKFQLKLSGIFRLIYSSILRFAKTNSYFKDLFENNNFEFGLLTTIPEQSGLGGSSSIIVATIYALAEYFGIYNTLSVKQGDLPINRDIIAEMAMKVEDIDLNITAGYADRYVISRGGLCFCSYVGKILHKEIGSEPLAVYDRIDETYQINNIPIIIAHSGVRHESGKVHKKLREFYFQGDKEIIESYKRLAILAWKSRFALMNQDWKLLGKYFKKNTLIMNNIMQKAGFKHGIGSANNFLIKIIEDNPDFYGIKLTGAGGGGSVFAIVNPAKINDLMSIWKNKLLSVIRDDTAFRKKYADYPAHLQYELKNAEFFIITIAAGVDKIYQKEG